MGRESRRNFGLIRPEREITRPERKGSVVIGYPVGGSVTLAFHASMLRLLRYELQKPDGACLLTSIRHCAGLYVSDNRQTLTEDFLSIREADWLLQIDTDIEFPPNLIESMLAAAGSDKRIVAASVPLGTQEKDIPSCGFNMTSMLGVWDFQPPPTAGPMEVDGIATAVALIHREVFEAIADRSGRCWWQHIYLDKPAAEGTPMRDRGFLSQGEDLAFSIRAREAGFKLWTVHLPGLKHYKTRWLTHDGTVSAASSALGRVQEEVGA